MAEASAGERRDGQKRKHETGGEKEGDENDDDDDDKNGKEEDAVEKKVPRLDIALVPVSALILIDRWDLPIHGGIAAALYQLIDQLKTCGLAVHCTVLENTGNTVREAERLEVNLILPERKPLFKKCKPNHIWLAAHEIFFPQIKKIANLKFIFGFGIVSSAIALDIKANILPAAEYFHVNVWKPKELTVDMFTMEKEMFESNRENLIEHNILANAVLSIGPRMFDYFKYKHDAYDPSIVHLQLIPLPDKVYFDLPTPTSLPDSRNFQILTPFEHCAMPELNHSTVIPKAMNSVASSFDRVHDEPPMWKILCTRKGDDKDVMNSLKPHAKLRILPDRLVNDSFSEEIRFSHLVIMPQTSINSLVKVLATIAGGKPIIVPKLSEGDYFIERYFRYYQQDVVVDMRGNKGQNALKSKIIDIVKHYPTYMKRASDMRQTMKTTVMEQLKELNSALMKEIKERLQQSMYQHSTSESQSRHLRTQESVQPVSGNSQPSTSQERGLIRQQSQEPQRTPGTIGMEVRTSYGCAANNTSMADVDVEFDRIEGDRPVTEGTARAVHEVHSDLNVDKVEKGCLRYVTKCGSLEALEALWSEYISGRLDKTIHSTIITPTLLSKIQAHYLTLDIYIPVQEYLLCKREIPLITGSVTIPSRRRSVASITELKATQQHYVPRHHTVDSLHLDLSSFQTAKGQTRPQLLSRDDFLIKELHHFRTTFTTKYDKVRLDVRLEEGKVGQSRKKRDKLWTDLNIESSSFYKEEEVMISEFVRLSTHSSQYSSQGKAVLHEAGQKLITQREFAISEATPVTEKSEAGKALFNELSSDVKRVNQGYPVKESVLEVFGKGSMPGQFDEVYGIYVKNNGQWVICDWNNHRVQVIDPIKLCCDLILQFHAFPNPFNPADVTVDEDNDQYFMSDFRNGQVVVSSGQSKILNCFGRKEGIQPIGICLSPDGFIFIGDWNGYVRKYNKSGEHIARTEEGQVSDPWDLIVNKKCIFVSDFGIGRKCVHVLNHQMQSIRDIGKGHLEWPVGLCFDHQQDGIYVCDIDGNRVVHFNCDGEFLSYKGQGQLERPRYIALCKDNPYRLVVTQWDCIKLLYI
ncbi:uncharacterized protein [Ptychodera flava]|uniref:uncharacterized protein n=1 Tax=Ptychodera flava TaxID=63121 RepID=UPI003969E8A6